VACAAFRPERASDFFSNAIGLLIIDKTHSAGKHIMMAKASSQTRFSAHLRRRDERRREPLFDARFYRNHWCAPFLVGAAGAPPGGPFHRISIPPTISRVSIERQKDGRRVFIHLNVTLIWSARKPCLAERKASSFIITPLFAAAPAWATKC